MNVMNHLLPLLLMPLVIQMGFAEFRAGASRTDISPKAFPVLVNGGFMSRTASTVTDPLYARSIVLSDGSTRIAIVVVDSCMMPRAMLDKAKEIAARRTGIPADHILVSATHTHTAPSAFACLGTDADPRYVPFLIHKIAQGIESAQKNLQPAEVGWHSVQASKFTALRRWILRPDRMELDPFGNRTVRATMHAGRNWGNVIGESGPEDPELAMLCIRNLNGRPLAVLANFSMHYFAGVKALSADYFGMFNRNLKQMIPGTDETFVGIMSHGCSGDIWRRDYTLRDWKTNPPKPDEQMKIESYAEGLARLALRGFDKVHYRSEIDLAMSERRMKLRYRVPDAQRLVWAKGDLARQVDRAPKDRTEVYANEQVILHELQETEIVIQALRIGDMAITTTPNETYALTGLKLKAMSPLEKTMVIELANGADGYIPPPEQHVLGGYNTWPARSAGLEEQAEPKIVEGCLQLLEIVSGKSRRIPEAVISNERQLRIDSRPLAYWTLDEFNGPHAVDISMNHHNATFESGVVFHLKGVDQQAAHFCGGRLRSHLPGLESDFTVSMHFWNGMPNGARKVAGWMFSRDHVNGITLHGDHLGLTGNGRIVFRHGDVVSIGRTMPYKRWKWMQATLVRNGRNVIVYANRKEVLSVKTQEPSFSKGFGDLFIGGRSDNEDNWEGRLDEIVIYDRALSGKELMEKVFLKQ